MLLYLCPLLLHVQQMFPEFIPLLRKLAALLPDAGQRFAMDARTESAAVAAELVQLWREAAAGKVG